MWFGLFLIFVAVPLLELALLIKVGQWIGFWPTIAIVLVTAIAGVAVMRSQGLKTVQAAMAAIAKGGTPVRHVIDGSFLMLAGTLLVSPGLITDCAGILLLIPQVRSIVARWSVRRFMANATVTSFDFERGGFEARQRGSRPPADPAADEPRFGQRHGHEPARDTPRSTTVIDGEFERIDESPKRPDPKTVPVPPSPARNKGPSESK